MCGSLLLSLRPAKVSGARGTPKTPFLSPAEAEAEEEADSAEEEEEASLSSEEGTERVSFWKHSERGQKTLLKIKCLKNGDLEIAFNS